MTGNEFIVSLDIFSKEKNAVRGNNSDCFNSLKEESASLWLIHKCSFYVSLHFMLHGYEKKGFNDEDSFLCNDISGALSQQDECKRLSYPQKVIVCKTAVEKGKSSYNQGCPVYSGQYGTFPKHLDSVIHSKIYSNRSKYWISLVLFSVVDLLCIYSRGALYVGFNWNKLQCPCSL